MQFSDSIRDADLAMETTQNNLNIFFSLTVTVVFTPVAVFEFIRLFINYVKVHLYFEKVLPSI